MSMMSRVLVRVVLSRGPVPLLISGMGTQRFDGAFRLGSFGDWTLRRMLRPSESRAGWVQGLELGCSV